MEQKNLFVLSSETFIDFVSVTPKGTMNISGKCNKCGVLKFGKEGTIVPPIEIYTEQKGRIGDWTYNSSGFDVIVHEKVKEHLENRYSASDFFFVEKIKSLKKVEYNGNLFYFACKTIIPNEQIVNGLEKRDFCSECGRTRYFYKFDKLMVIIKKDFENRFFCLEPFGINRPIFCTKKLVDSLTIENFSNFSFKPAGTYVIE